MPILLKHSCAFRAPFAPGLAYTKRITSLFRHVGTRQLCCLAFAVASLMLTGCKTTQKMCFHVAAVDIDSPNPDLKFYRVTIKAKGSNVKTDLQTGFYNANAVRQLYGNVSSSGADSTPLHQVGTRQFMFDPLTKQWQPVPDTDLFTIVFGVSAKAIADTIKAYNQSDAAGQQFASVLAAAAGRDVYLESVRAEQLQKDERAKLGVLLAKIKSLNDDAAKLTATLKPKDATPILVQAMQAAATQLGSSVQMDSNDLTGSLQKAQQLLDVLDSTKSK